MKIQSKLNIIAVPSLEQAVAKDFKVEEKDIKELLPKCSGEMPTDEYTKRNE